MTSPIKSVHVIAVLENGDVRLVAMDYAQQMFLQSTVEKHVGGKIKFRRGKLPLRIREPEAK